MKKEYRGKAPLALEDLLEQAEPPFTDDIMEVDLPAKFKMPTMPTYDGSKDPVEHVDTFRTWMELQGVRDAIKCRAFPFTLGGPARGWYRQLKPRSISSFKDLTRFFVTQFLGGRDHKKPATHLLTIRQK